MTTRTEAKNLERSGSHLEGRSARGECAKGDKNLPVAKRVGHLF
jgi:hypothetical protein